MAVSIVTFIEIESTEIFSTLAFNRAALGLSWKALLDALIKVICIYLLDRIHRDGRDPDIVVYHHRGELLSVDQDNLAANLRNIVSGFLCKCGQRILC